MEASNSSVFLFLLPVEYTARIQLSKPKTFQAYCFLNWSRDTKHPGPFKHNPKPATIQAGPGLLLSPQFAN